MTDRMCGGVGTPRSAGGKKLDHVRVNQPATWRYSTYAVHTKEVNGARAPFLMTAMRL
jgi:hypothetical protein